MLQACSSMELDLRQTCHEIVEKSSKIVPLGAPLFLINIGNRVTTHAAESTKDHGKAFFLRVPASQLVEVESRFIASLKPVHNRVGKKAAA